MSNTQNSTPQFTNQVIRISRREYNKVYAERDAYKAELQACTFERDLFRRRYEALHAASLLDGVVSKTVAELQYFADNLGRCLARTGRSKTNTKPSRSSKLSRPS